MGREMKPMKEKMKNHPYLFLAVVFTLLFLAGNELAAVTDTAESNYALTAKEMVLSGDWMSPRIYGHYWYDKPIFFIGNWHCLLPISVLMNLRRAFRRLFSVWRPCCILSGSPPRFMTGKQAGRRL